MPSKKIPVKNYFAPKIQDGKMLDRKSVQQKLKIQMLLKQHREMYMSSLQADADVLNKKTYAWIQQQIAAPVGRNLADHQI